ncbi:MAG: hypothetical protein ACUVXI_17635 [bacterium]
MNYYKLILEGGHMGAGKSYEVARFFQAKDIVDAFRQANRMPRVKGKHFKRGVKAIKMISRAEYLRGKRMELQDPYLSRHR